MDYRVFLQAWFDARAGRPSKRRFAARVHCSPSLLSAIIGGSRVLSLDRAEVFADQLQLDDDERRYFLALVTLEEGFAETERERALETILSTRRFHGARRLDDETWALLSRWYVAAVAELSRCEGFRGDAGWIAATVVPPISIDQAQEALDLLLELGALRRDDAGELVHGDAVWTTGHHVSPGMVSLALRRQHRSVLNLAERALDEAPPDDRLFSTLTFAAPDALLPELRRRLERFQEELVRLVSGTEDRGQRVWHLGVQLFALSRPRR